MNILIHYPGFINTDNQLAGTNRMLLTVAKHLSENNDVVIASERIKVPENVSKVNILPVSEPISNKVTAPFDIVIFCHGDRAVGLVKPEGQKWIRYQHCWNFPLNEYTDKYDAVAGVSDVHAEYMIACGIPARKMRIIPNCINLEKFYKRNVFRDEKSIMYCGSIEVNKGLHILLHAVKDLPGGIHVDVYGSAAMTNSPESYMKTVMDIASGMNVTFNGAVGKDRLAEAYSKNSILCLPSELESFGLVLAEAQSCGCIPVVHDCGGVSAAVQRGKTAVLYAPNTVEQLHKTISAVLRNRINEKKRTAAIEFSRNKFDKKNTHEAVDKILKEILR